jgi:23S rRNA pseudouridine1911/1915/1917 synthase
MGAERHQFTAGPEDDGQRLDVVVAGRIPGLSRSQAQRLIKTGHVIVGGAPAKPSAPVEAGATIAIDIPPPVDDTPAPEPLPLTVLYQDEALAVIEKPAGMVVHPGAGHAAGTLVNALRHHLVGLSGIGGRTRPGIVHRLDRGTSGLMVVAKHDAAHQALSKQFADRLVTKQYTTLVWGHPEPGEVFDTPIGRDPGNRQRMSGRAQRARPALTRVVSARRLGELSLLTVSIESGRTHQIRVHLSEAGHPVAGDAVYGGKRRGGPAAVIRLDRPFLHASHLAFTHPVDGRPMVFDSPLSPDLQQVVDTLTRRHARPAAIDTDDNHR